MRDDEYDRDSDMYQYEFRTTFVHNIEQFTVHFKQNETEILITKLRQLQKQNIRNLLLLFRESQLCGTWFWAFEGVRN